MVHLNPYDFYQRTSGYEERGNKDEGDESRGYGMFPGSQIRIDVWRVPFTQSPVMSGVSALN